jgi:hypothetical protein
MPYITSVERIGREEGLREGLLEGIELALTLKFGPAGQELLPEIRELTDLTVIRAVQAAAIAARTVDEVRKIYA